MTQHGAVLPNIGRHLRKAAGRHGERTGSGEAFCFFRPDASAALVSAPACWRVCHISGKFSSCYGFQKCSSCAASASHTSRLERLQGCDNFHAKRIACELMKAWVVANRESDEDTLDLEEVRAYKEFVVNMLHYYDRWAGKYWASDGFCETFVAVEGQLEGLEELLRVGGDSAPDARPSEPSSPDAPAVLRHAKWPATIGEAARFLSTSPPRLARPAVGVALGPPCLALPSPSDTWTA